MTRRPVSTKGFEEVMSKETDETWFKFYLKLVESDRTCLFQAFLSGSGWWWSRLDWIRIHLDHSLNLGKRRNKLVVYQTQFSNLSYIIARQQNVVFFHDCAIPVWQALHETAECKKCNFLCEYSFLANKVFLKYGFSKRFKNYRRITL